MPKHGEGSKKAVPFLGLSEPFGLTVVTIPKPDSLRDRMKVCL